MLFISGEQGNIYPYGQYGRRYVEKRQNQYLHGPLPV